MPKPSLKYLQLLSEKYPTIQAASTAIINYSAQLQLPKGTEHFLSDVHGEHEAFNHVIRNGAGAIWRQIEEMFGNTLSKSERRNLATLIYYPELKIPLMLQSVEDKEEWFRLKIVRLVKFCRNLTAKYRRSTVRSYLPSHLAETIEELIYDQDGSEFKSVYYQNQIDTIVATGSAATFIITIAALIRRLAVERLHVIGDIYDRGQHLRNLQLGIVDQRRQVPPLGLRQAVAEHFLDLPPDRPGAVADHVVERLVFAMHVGKEVLRALGQLQERREVDDRRRGRLDRRIFFREELQVFERGFCHDRTLLGNCEGQTGAGWFCSGWNAGWPKYLRTADGGQSSRLAFFPSRRRQRSAAAVIARVNESSSVDSRFQQCQ